MKWKPGQMPVVCMEKGCDLVKVSEEPQRWELKPIPPGVDVSHGICPDHYAMRMAEVRAFEPKEEDDDEAGVGVCVGES